MSVSLARKCLARHNVHSGEGPVQKEANGSVYVFEEAPGVVVKLFASHECFAKELQGLGRCAGAPSSLLATVAPRILACGTLTTRAGHVVRYIVMSRVVGKALRNIRKPCDMLNVAWALGRCLRELHASRVCEANSSDADTHWRHWCDVLDKRRRQIGKARWLRKLLKPSAMAQLAPDSSFWPRSFMELVKEGDTPCFLHGDLNNENVILRKRRSIERNIWIFSGVIDFGDCCVGHRLYDMIAVYLSVFSCDKTLLTVFLSSYGYEWLPPAVDFPRICMYYCVLAESPALRTACHHVPQIRKCSTLAEIGNLLFDLTKREKN